MGDVLAAGKVVAEVKSKSNPIQRPASPLSTIFPISSAILQADVVILTFPSPSSVTDVHKFASEILPQLKDGAVVIDTTNPLSSPSLDLVPSLSGTTSVGEEFQKALPKAHVYKALNSIGAQHFGTKGAGFGGKETQALYAGGEHPDATVSGLLRDIGFRGRWVGPIRHARNLESLAELWVHMAYISKAGSKGKVMEAGGKNASSQATSTSSHGGVASNSTAAGGGGSGSASDRFAFAIAEDD